MIPMDSSVICDRSERFRIPVDHQAAIFRSGRGSDLGKGVGYAKKCRWTIMALVSRIGVVKVD